MINILISILVGALAGALADKMFSRFSFSVWIQIILGIVGGFVGGWVLGDDLEVVLSLPSLISRILTAFIGALIILGIAALIKGKKAQSWALSELQCPSFSVFQIRRATLLREINSARMVLPIWPVSLHP